MKKTILTSLLVLSLITFCLLIPNLSGCKSRDSIDQRLSKLEEAVNREDISHSRIQDLRFRTKVVGEISMGKASFYLRLAEVYYENLYWGVAIEFHTKVIDLLEEPSNQFKKCKKDYSAAVSFGFYKCELTLTLAHLGRAQANASIRSSTFQKAALADLLYLHQKGFLKKLVDMGILFWEEPSLKSLEEFPRYRELVDLYKPKQE